MPFPDAVYEHWNSIFAYAGKIDSAPEPIETGPQLTEEEDRMLAAFRQFKALLVAPKGNFYWQTQPNPGVILAPERVLIIDPAADPKEGYVLIKPA